MVNYTLARPQASRVKTAVAQFYNSESMLKIGVWLMGIALVSLGVVYISTVIRVSVRGYAIRELQTELSALEQTARENDQKVAQLQSVERVQERMGDLKMVAIGPVEYLKAQPAVALAR